MNRTASELATPNPSLRAAQLTSSIGAGVLGVGIGALAGHWIGALAGPALVVGLMLHALGMSTQHRLENDAATVRPWWSTALYWACWLGLLAIVVLMALRATRY